MKPTERPRPTQHAPTPGRPPVVLHARVVAGSGGGPDKTILTSPRFLRPLGYDSTCLYLRPPGDVGFAALRERALDLRAPLVEIDDRGALDWRILGLALAACRRLRVDVWHGHDYKTNLLGLLLRRRHPMRLVSTVHGWVHNTLRTPLYYRIDRWSLRRYERVVCVSEDLFDQCARWGKPADRLVLIENAIDAQQFCRRRPAAEAKQRLGLPPETLLLGAVGRLSPEKGFDRLIDVVARLRGELAQPFGLVVVGEGSERGALQQQIDRLGLGGCCRLVGYQSDTIAWYEAMDVFVLSSLREGLPNVLLEAMALGVPVVTTRVAGAPRLVEDGVAGLTVPIDDQDALAAALARVIGDPPLRARLASAARRVIETRYSFPVRMEKMAGVYRSLGIVGCPPAPSDGE